MAAKLICRCAVNERAFGFPSSNKGSRSGEPNKHRRLQLHELLARILQRKHYEGTLLRHLKHETRLNFRPVGMLEAKQSRLFRYVLACC